MPVTLTSVSVSVICTLETKPVMLLDQPMQLENIFVQMGSIACQA